MAQSLHPGFDGVHWEHGCMLCDASYSSGNHVLQDQPRVGQASEYYYADSRATGACTEASWRVRGRSAALTETKA